ncbi:MAG TPA: S8 family serine peptidase, partial [Solirubrobacteraceae bacterium]
MPLPSPRPLLLAAALAGACLATIPASAAAAGYVPGEVLVRYHAGVDRAARAAVQRATGTGRPRAFAPRTRVLQIRGRRSVGGAIRALRRHPEVASATPNHIAHASAFLPDDPGSTGQPGGWSRMQWNFLAGNGINAPDAWENLIAAGRPGGSGVVVAVLDTGIAYADRRSFRRSPDMGDTHFRRGYDFVAEDPYPNDQNGHGTHVASTIAESVDNGYGLTGIAYGASIMPIRVLDARGDGDSA